MEHLYLLLTLALFYSAFSVQVPAPVNLTMDSHNFVHLLTWESGPSSPEGVHYTVTFRSAKEYWKTANGCGWIGPPAPLQCNLTKAFSNPYEIYYVNVTAKLQNHTSTPVTFSPFKPEIHTVLDPPTLSVHACNFSLCVHLQPPANPMLLSSYQHLTFRLHISSGLQNSFSVDIRGLSDHNQKRLLLGQQYCVSISIVGRISSGSSSAVCATLPAHPDSAAPVTEVVVSVVLGVVALLGCSLILLAAGGFFCLKTDFPSALSIRHYVEQMGIWNTVEPVSPVTVEPCPLGNIAGDDNSEEEDEEGEEERVYERQGTRNACYTGTSETSCSSGSAQNQTPSPAQGLQHEGSSSPATGRLQQAAGLLSAPLPALGITTEMKKEEKESGSIILHPEGDVDGGSVEEKSSFSVNLSSLVVGGQRKERWYVEEKSINREHLLPEETFSVQEASRNSLDIPATSLPASQRQVFISEEEQEEEEEEEEEEEYSDYVTRN